MTVPAGGNGVDVSVVIVNYNTKHVLSRTIAALEEASKGLHVQVIVVDNASRDGSADFVRSTWPRVTLLANERNVGFGRANNQALSLLRGTYVLLLNPDAFLSPGSLTIALDYIENHPDCGILGARLVGGPDESTVGSSARNFPTPWRALLTRTGLSSVFPSHRLVDDPDWDYRKSAECDWVPGAFFLIRKSVIDQVGFFDPRYFLYSEEVDFCRTAKAAGWKVHYCADSVVVHVGGESAKSVGKLGHGSQLSALQIESELLYYRKQYGLAGFIAALALGIASDAINGLKRLVGRARGTNPFAWSVLALPLSLRTRLGTRATR
jgi:N-acetylglucosaminyl-diphospho-decaprenol L-rhamnosyltransferase